MPFQAAVIKHKEGPLEIVECADIAPGADEVLIKTHACGCCHSDVFLYEGRWTEDHMYPLAPGHEVAGEVIAVGPGPLSSSFKIGDRVAVGWYGGCCHSCEACREGQFLNCKNPPPTTGIKRHGGYAQMVTARADACARIPDGLEYTQAGPLACAGLTMWSALKQNLTHAPPGSTIAIIGMGGLGHLGVQFASRMGYRTVAISRGQAKKQYALDLGAHVYIDSVEQDPVQVLKDLGGAKVIVATNTGGHDTLGSYLGALSHYGVMVIAGVDDGHKHISFDAVDVIYGTKSIRGVAVGNTRDLEEAMAFSQLFNVRVKTDVFPFARVKEAWEKMLSGKGDLRVVLDYDV